LNKPAKTLAKLGFSGGYACGRLTAGLEGLYT